MEDCFILPNNYSLRGYITKNGLTYKLKTEWLMSDGLTTSDKYIGSAEFIKNTIKNGYNNKPYTELYLVKYEDGCCWQIQLDLVTFKTIKNTRKVYDTKSLKKNI